MIRRCKERKLLLLKRLKNPHVGSVKELLKDELEWVEGLIRAQEEALEKRQGGLFG